MRYRLERRLSPTITVRFSNYSNAATLKFEVHFEDPSRVPMLKRMSVSCVRIGLNNRLARTLRDRGRGVHVKHDWETFGWPHHAYFLLGISCEHPGCHGSEYEIELTPIMQRSTPRNSSCGVQQQQFHVHRKATGREVSLIRSHHIM